MNLISDKKGGENINNALGFIKSNIQSENIGILLYLIINVIIIVSYVPIGEKVLRWQLGVKEIVREEQLERLMPLFEEVYEKAKQKFPNIQNDIQLYIKNDEEKNAFATLAASHPDQRIGYLQQQ